MAFFSAIPASYLCMILIGLWIPSCQAKNHLDEITSLMTGSFSSEEQAVRDSNYYDIRLEMVPIWKNMDAGTWLYVEQAAAGALERPYRQRIYQLVEGEDCTIQSIVYSLPDPLKYAGAWKDTDRFAQLRPDSLKIRSGCVVILKRTGPEEYHGRTNQQDCQSNLRGASFATTEVIITRDKIISWDRGFDSEGLQVWGTTQGGYVFNKIMKK